MLDGGVDIFVHIKGWYMWGFPGTVMIDGNVFAKP